MFFVHYGYPIEINIISSRNIVVNVYIHKKKTNKNSKKYNNIFFNFTLTLHS